MVSENHNCYIPPWEPKPLPKKTRLIRIYFDIETSASDQFEDKNNWMEHKPNVLISHQVCEKCEHDKELEHGCLNCGEREQIFESIGDFADDNVVGQFLTYLKSLCSEEKTEIICFSHNGRAFDTYFILQECIRRKLQPEVILNGAKVISLKIGNIHFKDSLMFVPQKLSSLPKAFGLSELRKGFFPHLMNRKEFYSYIGPMPEKELYCTSTMSAKEKQEFDVWYQGQVDNNYVFNFKYEILTYCQSDVDILRQAMETFRTAFMEIGGFCPLYHCITLSSCCMNMYRYKHMTPYTLGIPPRGGFYRGRDKQSFVALKWLDYEQHKLGNTAKITTAENGNEVRVMGRPVDGYTEIKRADGTREQIIYQFYGCYWHFCPTCISDQKTRVRLRREAGEDRYDKTMRITDIFKRNQYTVVEMWECQFNHESQNNPEMKAFFEQHTAKRTEPLNLRDALCGGRTSALRSYKKADLSKGERIKFFDICSEYPFINHKGTYVTGHCAIFLEDEEMPQAKTWNGAVKATVLPPQDLFLPVLPYKCCNKLMFPLCRSCTEAQSQESCTHDKPDERSFTGTWCANEFQLALEKGYTPLKIHELHQYPEVKVYNEKTKTDGLFSAYVRENMAMKYEASGWPPHIKTDEQKDRYIQDIFERDGIVIQKDRVEKNPGKRTLAKLILNSFCKYTWLFLFLIVLFFPFFAKMV